MSQARTPTAQDAKFDDNFKKLNDEMAEALKQLEANEAALQNLKNQKEVGYFSSAKLQYELTFEEKTEQQFLEDSGKQKNRIKEMMVANKRAYDDYQQSLKEYNEKYSTNIVRLNIDRNFLIADLITWKEKNTASVADRLKGKVDKQIEEVIAKIGTEESLRKKSSDELRDITKLINNDTSLHQQAVKLCTASHFNDMNYRSTQPKAPELIAYNSGELIELNKILGGLTAKYQAAAKSLSIRSHEAFDVIAKENQKIKDEMRLAIDKINQAMNSFVQAKAEYKREAIFDNCQKMFHKYSKLNALVLDLKKLEKDYKKWEQKTHDILERYKRTKIKYGDCPTAEVAKTEGQLVQYNRELELLQRQVKSIDIKALKVMYTTHNILCLIKSVIENNLDFWKAQVSFAGSTTTINTVPVPNGISIIYEAVKSFDPKYVREENENILHAITHDTRIRNVTKNKVLRKDSTTDCFYKEVGDVWVECLKTNEDPDVILLHFKEKLRKIIDKKGNRLVLDGSPKVISSPKPLGSPVSPSSGADQKQVAGGAGKFFPAAVEPAAGAVKQHNGGSSTLADLDAMEKELDALIKKPVEGDSEVQSLPVGAVVRRK